jgi:DNA-binding transcriptional regulator YiaG
VPFCHLSFSATRPAIRRYERVKVPAGTLGAAFRERRWSRHLEQWQAAHEIGVSVDTYRAWETNRRRPELRHLPAAICFLGFDWRKAASSLSEQIRRARTAAGMSIRELAAIFRVDPATLRAWEVGVHAPTAHAADLIVRWLDVRNQACRIRVAELIPLTGEAFGLVHRYRSR